MHKPALHAVHDLHYGGLVFRAGLSELVAVPDLLARARPACRTGPGPGMVDEPAHRPQHHRRTRHPGLGRLRRRPLGYDAAMLYALSLLAPATATATTIRRELHVLNTSAGNTALLIDA
ncbi:hypothetical protein HEP87_08090 [Streptomyces sp. S1D4-11]